VVVLVGGLGVGGEGGGWFGLSVTKANSAFKISLP
jgi:hypothetical protein